MSDTTARVTVNVGTNADTAPVDRYTKSVLALQNGLKSLLTTGGAAELGGAFTAGALSVQAMVGKISEAISGSSELAKEMQAVERRVLLSGEAFQVMSRAGKIGSDELIAGLGKYRVELGKALEGDKGARKVFEDTLKLSPEQLTQLPLQRQMEMVGQAVQKLGDTNKEAYAAQQLFGKGYTQMIPLLNTLATQGYEKVRESLIAMGAVLPTDKENELLAVQKKLSLATRELEIALTPTNLRLLEMKKNVAEFLSANAGPIQSGGTALAGGLLTYGITSQLIARMPAQFSSFGDRAILAFKHAFAGGLKTLPNLIEESFAGEGARWGNIGRMIATPMGATMAVVLGDLIIKELERSALENIERRDQELAAGKAEIDALREKILKAATPVQAREAFNETALAYAQRQQRFAELQAKQKEIDDFNASLAQAGGEAALGTRSLPANEANELQKLQQEVPILQALFLVSQQRGAAIAKQNELTNEHTAALARENAELQKAQAAHDTFAEREQAANYAGLKNDAQRMAYLQKWKAEEQDEWAKKIAATQSADLKAEYELQARVKIADIDAKIATVRESIKHWTEETAKASEDESQWMVDEIDKLERINILRTLDTDLHKISIDRARTESDFHSTAIQKWIAEQAILARELAAVDSAIKQLEGRRAPSAATGADTTQDDAELQRLRDRRDSLQVEQIRAQGQPNPNSLGEQMDAELMSIGESFGTLQQNIAHGFGEVVASAIQTCVDGLQSLLGGTEYWTHKLGAAGAVVGTLTKAISEIAVKWVAQQIWMHTVGPALAAASLAATAPIAIAQAAIWATPATLATIASFGGAAAAAPGEMAGAIGAAMGLAVFASEGGYFPGDPRKPRGIFHGDEVIFSAPAVRNLGADNLLALHEAGKKGMSFGPPPIPDSLRRSTGIGGLSGGGSGGQSKERPLPSAAMSTHVFMYADFSAALRAYHESPAGQKQFINAFQQAQALG